jgi:RsiW-degrading membrane proteinase PrsW (M82 family)
MILFFLAVCPAIAIFIFIYYKDKFEKEPLRLLIISFLLGVLSCVPAFILELIASKIGLSGESSSLISSLLGCVIGIGLVEEFCKYFFVKIGAFKNEAFNEPYDGIIYCVMVSLGFATLENIGYVFENGIGTAISRMIFSVPGHAAWGVIMGYYLGVEKFKKKPYFGLIGLLIASILHGLFDFCLFNASKHPVLLVGFLIVFIFTIRLSYRSIKQHQNDSPFNRH